MADKPQTEAPGAGTEKSKRKRKSAVHGHVFLSAGMVAAGVFYSTSALLMVGMMPTVVVVAADMMRTKTKAITVGAMNLAGCAPFLIDLWTHGHSLDDAIEIISNPRSIVVMYAAAAAGYIIDWSLTGVVAGILYQRGVARKDAIRRRQEELAVRWGEEVTGTIPLDEHGFSLEKPDDEA